MGMKFNLFCVHTCIVMALVFGPQLQPSNLVISPFLYCNRRNKKVYAWTVDDEDSMKKMLFERVDAIVTSNPSLLQRLMQDVRTQCLEEGFSLST